MSLFDVTPHALSAVYFFYAPSIARLSPGVGNVMLCLELARQWNKQHVYLGYRVEGCPSLRYKGNFAPHQLLVGKVEPGAPAPWVDAAT
ncbi:MAG: hypothetical protein ACOZIN_22650 [Myxococcota bacterium]